MLDVCAETHNKWESMESVIDEAKLFSPGLWVSFWSSAIVGAKEHLRREHELPTPTEYWDRKTCLIIDSAVFLFLCASPHSLFHYVEPIFGRSSCLYLSAFPVQSLSPHYLPSLGQQLF